MSKPLTRAELGQLAEAIRAVLAADSSGEAPLTQNMRARWEGALTVAEVALGDTPSRVAEGFLDGLL